MKKVIFAGLDASGKTSIILALLRKFSLLSSVRPTIGRNIHEKSIKILGLEISAWDLGGQQIYREEHFREKYHIFARASLIFYVIDITDTKRFDESIGYLKKIVEIGEEFGDFPPIFIMLHKLDPDVVENPKYIKNIEFLRKEIPEKTGLKTTRFFTTSIHDETSLIRAFSEGILRISEKSRFITTLLKDYAKTTFSSAVLLLDENAFIIGAHYKEELYKDICITLAPQIAMTIERLGNYDLAAEEVIIRTRFTGKKGKRAKKENMRVLVFLKDFIIEKDIRLYIVSLSKNERTLKLSLQYLPELADKLRNLLLSM